MGYHKRIITAGLNDREKHPVNISAMINVKRIQIIVSDSNIAFSIWLFAGFVHTFAQLASMEGSGPIVPALSNENNNNNNNNNYNT